MRRAAELGIEAPSSLESWADFFPRYTILPWLNGRNHARLQTMREYLRLAFKRVPIAVERRGGAAEAVRELVAMAARWRLDHDVYAFPVELWLREALHRWGNADGFVLLCFLLLTSLVLLLEWMSVARRNEPYYYLRRPSILVALVVLTVLLAPGNHNAFIYFAF